MIILDVNQSEADEENRLSGQVIDSIAHELNEGLGDAYNGIVAVSYVRDEEIRRLNRIYRKKDSVTDVLSFGYLENQSTEESIGDVVISFAQAKRQAVEGDLELELVDLIVHGVLHVLGYDHETPQDAQKMFPLQDKIVAHVL